MTVPHGCHYISKVQKFDSNTFSKLPEAEQHSLALGLKSTQVKNPELAHVSVIREDVITRWKLPK